MQIDGTNSTLRGCGSARSAVHPVSAHANPGDTSLKLQEMQLMRLASYITAVLDLRWNFQCQGMNDEVYVEVDSAWKQCPRTRRST